MEIIQEIQNRINEINATPQQMYAMLKNLGGRMFAMNNMPKSDVVMFCATMIKLYKHIERNQ